MGDATGSQLKTPQSLGLFTIDAIIRHRAVNEPQAPVIGYPASRQGVSDYELFTGKDLDRLIDGAVKEFLNIGFKPVFEENMVFILGASDLDYIVNIFALGRLGYTTFLISPRLAPFAISKLVDSVKATTLIYASHLLSLATDTAEKYESGLKLIPMLTRLSYDHHHNPSPPFSRQGIDPETETKKKMIMLHSSGSTGVPKPVHYTNARLLATLLTAQPLQAFQSIPIFHAHGFVTLIQAIWTAKTVYLFNGHVPQTHFTITEAIERCEPEIVYTVPYTLKLVAERQKGVDVLRRCKVVSISGSKCPDELGDLLVREGVHFGTSFGATEVALILTSLNRPREDKAWNYLRPPPHIAPFILMKPLPGYSDPVIHECVVLDGHKGKMKSNSDDPPNSYCTSDLFIAHPIIHNAWKFVGRLDDRITLTNGEKVLPLAIEGRIMQETCVKDAVVFGVEREVPGLLLFRADSENTSEAEFLTGIWPAIEDANLRSEAFSQISREMVVVLPKGVECPTTDKGSIKRAQAYLDFADIIDEVYTKLHSPQGAELNLDAAEMEIWIVKTFHTLGVVLEDETTDFFGAGVDSLKAIQMRGLIVKNLDMKGSADSVPSMIVYDCGNAERLAKRLVEIREGLVDAEELSDGITEMEEMIERFSIFNKRTLNNIENVSQGTVILLTGATGSLGAHILSKLAAVPHVLRVYCAIRKSQSFESAREILERAIVRQGFPKSTLTEKVVTITTDNSGQDFGLPNDAFRQLQNEVTHIIHCAWNVNFVLPVTAFMDQLKGVQNLAKFSLSPSLKHHPMKMIFCSSIGVVMATPRGSEDISIAETPIHNLLSASATGYAQSKLVAEKIIETATRDFGADAIILRIGQIIPAPKSGSQLWNPDEMIPLIVRSAVATGVLPDVPGPGGDDRCGWIDTETLASTILDIAELSGLDGTNNNDSQLVYNLVNPVSISWKHVFLAALKKSGLDFEIVSWNSWLSKLRNTEEDNPTRRLLGFWEGLETDSDARKKRGRISFKTKNAEQRSKSFQEAKVLVDDEYVKKLLYAWKDAWQSVN